MFSEFVLARAALTLLPIFAAWRFLAWGTGPLADHQALLALQSVAPEEHAAGGYVSSGECQGCHPDAYRAWHDSYHRTMTQLATPDAVLGDFDDVELSVLVPGKRPNAPQRIQRYRLSERDGGFFVTLLGSRPGEPDQTGRIVMTTGSHHQQLVWAWAGQGRELFNLPFTYLISEQRWIPRRDAFLSPPDEVLGPVVWSEVCIQCHSTHGRPRIPEQGGASPRVGDFGIACESCHGPANEHVSANRVPWHRYQIRGEADPNIVNPERLTARRATDVCGRCHGVLSYPGRDGWRGEWNDFVPGEDLATEGRLVIHPESHDPLQREIAEELARDETGPSLHEKFWSDGMLRVAGREVNDVETSPCFAGGEFSCLSCHSMHGYESRADQLRPGVNEGEACLSCHASLAADVSAHTKHEADSAGSSCLDCHMPYTTYGLLKAIRSHRISSPSVAVELETGRPNACNGCHLDQSLAWTRAHLEDDWGIAPAMLSGVTHEAAGPRWMATGDAGVRALAAAYMGWRPAQQASGSDWMAPYLAELLADPYAAVRAVAARSLRTLPGHGALEFDFVETPMARRSAVRAWVQEQWLSQLGEAPRPVPGPLAAREGVLDRMAWLELVKERDVRPLTLIE